jgi:hypothetical protein
MAAVNQQLVATYWAIDQAILNRQDQQGWGTRVIDRRSVDLRERFSGRTGLLAAEPEVQACLRRRLAEGAIVQATLAQLPWYHHVTLIDRLLGSELRLWCAAAAIAEWATTGTTALTEELTSSPPRIQDIEAELAGQ